MVVNAQSWTDEWQELAEYLGSEFQPAKTVGTDRLVAEEYRTFRSEEDFYRGAQSYLYDLTAFSVSRTKEPYRSAIRCLLPRGASLLDYGCGIGSDGLKFIAEGYDVSFADFASPSTEYLNWRLRRRHLNSPIHTLDSLIEDRQYDLVYAFDVLEHVSDPRTLLSRIERLGRYVAVNFITDGPSDRFPMHHEHDWEALERWIAERMKVLLCINVYSNSRLVIYATDSAGARVPVFISVVIPTFNRSDILHRTLQAYAQQTMAPNGCFEVIVVDDGSSDRTEESLQEYQATFPLRVLHQKHAGANAARNLGLRTARGWVVVFTGDDMVPPPSFLEDHLRFHLGNAADEQALLGRVDWHPALSVNSVMEYVTSESGGHQFAFGRLKPGKADFRYFYTSNVSLKRAFLLAQDALFDADFTLPAYDDIEFGYRLQRAGMVLNYSPRVYTHHYHPLTAAGFTLRQRRAGTMAVLFAEKHPELDDTLLGARSIRKMADRSTELTVEALLQAALELEKPDLQVLANLTSGGADLGRLYKEQLLFPVYRQLFDLAHSLGVLDALDFNHRFITDVLPQTLPQQSTRSEEMAKCTPGRTPALLMHERALAVESRNQSATLGLDIVPRGHVHQAPPPPLVDTHTWETLEHRLDATAFCSCGHSAPLVSIIIPTYNRIDLTRQCLEALRRNTPAAACEVIVVDNGSTDGTSKLLQREQERGNLRAILNEENIGFAKACNLGASQAHGKYLLFLNNDTVPLPGWLDALLATAEADPTVGAVGSKLLFPDGTIQHAGVIVVQNKREPEPLVPVHVHYRKPSDYRPANRPFLYQALTAACLLIRRGAFEAAGGYDEGFWNGYEDVDLCFRLQEQGWHLVYQPESVVIHAESQSGPMRFARTRENVKRLQAKWLDKIAPDYIVDEDGRVVEPETKRARPYQASGLGSADRPTQPAVEGPLVSVIILTRNQLAHTKACLQSIEQNTPLPYELIVVDNGSSDGTIPYLRQYALAHANTQVIANASNRGFAAGNNQGLALASGRHVLLLNNDTVVTAGWLERLLAVFEQHPEVGLVGPMSNYVSGPQLIPAVPHHSAAALDAFAARWATEHAGESVPVTRLVGFCLLIRREVIERIGGLDERFGTGNFEDDDFCLRAARAGFEARIACDVLVHHAGSQTFKGENLDYRQSMQHNWELFKAKWGIPGDVPLEQGYRPPLELVDPEGAFIALPNLAASHELAPDGRWWQERPGQEEQASASVDAAREPETDAESRLRQVLEQSNAAVANGQLHVAASALHDFVRELPDVAGAQAALGAVLLAQGKPGQAVPHLKRASELAPGDVNLRNQLGVALFQTGDSEAAEEAFLAALQLAPTDVDALLNAVEVYRSQGQYEEATEYLKQATAVAPHDPNVLLAVGSIGLELGDTDAGRVALARLRDIDPAHPFVRDLQEALVG